MGRKGRRVLLVLAVVAALPMILGVGLWLLPWGDWLRGELGRRLTDASGRTVTVAHLHLHPGLTLRLQGDGIHIDNAPWGSSPTMVEIDRLEFSLYLPSLLRGRVVVPELRLTRPRLLLEKNAQGEANWHFANPQAKAAKAAIPERRQEMPLIEHLVVEDGRLIYRDPGKGMNFDSRINTALGGDPTHTETILTGQGQLQVAPFHLEVHGGSILELRESRQPYPLRLDAQVGDTRTQLDGTLTDPLQLSGIDLRLHVSGRDMADIFPIFGIPLPHTPAYRLEGQLVRQGNIWAFRDFAGQVGGSDLKGTLQVAVEKPRPRLQATLTSTRLAIADLSGFVGGQPGGGEAPKKEANRVLPATPVNLQKLRSMDMDVHFQGRSIDAGPVAIDDLQAALKIDDGLAVIDPLSLDIAGGRVQGRVTLDGRRDMPAAALDLGIEKLALDRLLKSPDISNRMAGLLGGRLRLKGQGSSTADILGDADGQFTLFMGHGSFSHLALELIGLDVAKALGVLATGDQPIAVRCLVADMPLRQGVLQAQTLVLDTEVSAVTGEGQINLRDETLNLRLLAHPKKPSLFSARAPVLVGGSFHTPSFGVDPAAEAARGTAAAALGALLTPLGALLPFIDLGLGQDSPCRQLIDEARGGTEH